jgi:hypothetical protein
MVGPRLTRIGSEADVRDVIELLRHNYDRVVSRSKFSEEPGPDALTRDEFGDAMLALIRRPAPAGDFAPSGSGLHMKARR